MQGINSDSISELSQMVKIFCEERDWDQFHGAKDLGIGLVTESSELLELFRFQAEADLEELLTKTPTREKIGDELADVLFFLLRFGQRFGFDLGVELKRKMLKNAQRYSVEKAKGSNEKR